MEEDIVSLPVKGDCIGFVPHRLFSLAERKLAVIAEGGSGWLVADEKSYASIADYFNGGTVKLDREIEPDSVFSSLWKADLLTKNGASIGKAVQVSAPALLSLKMTGHCNFRCTYCYDYDEERFNKDIPLEKVYETISFLLSKNDGITILFHGGEALLQFKQIKKIVDFAIKKSKFPENVNFSLQTNGSIFTDKIVDFLDEHKFSVGISLNGMTEAANKSRVTNSRKTCLEFFMYNYNKYKDFLIRRSGIVTVISKENIREIPDFVIWLQNLGIKGVFFNLLNISGRGVDVKQSIPSAEEVISLFKKLIQMIRTGEIKNLSIENVNKYINSLLELSALDVCHKSPCGAAGDFLVIDSEGRFRACDCVYHDYLLMESDSVEKTITDDTRLKIQNRALKMRDNHCSSCPFFGLCGGSCVAIAVMNNGSDEVADKIECQLKRFFYKTLFTEYAFDPERPLFKYYSKFKYLHKTER